MNWCSGPYGGTVEAHTEIGTYKIVQYNNMCRVIINGVVIYYDICDIELAKESARRHYEARPE